jgi:hypothetical protein
LPSRKAKDEQKMYKIGRKFGELTLLVDVVRDAEDDKKTGNFNAWRAAFDLPQDIEGVRKTVKESFEELKHSVQPLSEIACSYVESAEKTIVDKLGIPVLPPSSMMLGLILPLFAECGEQAPPPPTLEETCLSSSGHCCGWIVFCVCLSACCGGGKGPDTTVITEIFHHER